MQCFSREILYNQKMYRVQIHQHYTSWNIIGYTVTISEKERVFDIFTWYHQCFKETYYRRANNMPDYSTMMRDAFRSYQTQLDQKAKYEAMVKAAKNLPPLTTENVMKED